MNASESKKLSKQRNRSRKRVVICGGGIIGCSIAYYLTLLNEELDVSVIERASVACHSSGKAGGFLALDWNDRSPVGPLARASYALHKELSQTLKNDTGIDIQYRELDTYSLSAAPYTTKSRSNDQNWIDCKVISKERLGSAKTTSQVNPYQLTNALCKAAQNRGAELVIDKVIGVESSSDTPAKIKSVILENGSIDADVVVIAMGAWSGIVKNFFPLYKSFPKIKGSRAHSIVVESDVPPEALFVEFKENGITSEPEIYPRPDGSVYICGQGDEEPLPDDPTKVVPKQESCKRLQEIACSVSSALDGKLLKSQACYLPVSERTGPIISKIPLYDGAFIATGHSCWGILNGPITGLVVAQLILNLKPEVDLTKFSLP